MSGDTSSNVVRLVPTTFGPGNKLIAENLRAFADYIEEGGYGDVRVAMLIAENYAGEIHRASIGDVIDRARAVGLMTTAIHRALAETTDESTT